jgi:hypothetical protein
MPWICGDLTECEPEVHEGLTKRELFAAMVLQGLSANPECNNVAIKTLVESAVEQADAFIEALNNKEGE